MDFVTLFKTSVNLSRSFFSACMIIVNISLSSALSHSFFLLSNFSFKELIHFHGFSSAFTHMIPKSLWPIFSSCVGTSHLFPNVHWTFSTLMIHPFFQINMHSTPKQPSPYFLFIFENRNMFPITHT